MNTVSSDIIDKIIEIVKSGGGEVYEQPGFVNFCGVRNNATNDTFNDTLYIYWKEGDAFTGMSTNGFTTKPGKKVILNSDGKQNKKGAAILKEGWHKDIWHIGKHQNKYTALRSTSGVTNPTAVTRDNTQFGKGPNYELRVFEEKKDVGFFGVNFHKSNTPQGNSVNGWSAGCQVFKVEKDFNYMLERAQIAANEGQKKFSYFLVNKSVFDEENIVDDGGEPYESSYPQSAGGDSGSTSSQHSQYSNSVSGLGSAGWGESSGAANGGGETSNSFGNDVIFGQVFPNDDNNRYIEMSSDDISVIQYSEPTLKVEELNISPKSQASLGAPPDKISYNVPVVFINDFMIPQTNITNFCLDYTSFAPQVMVEFVDMTNEMLSTNIPKPGSYIKVFIGGYGDENYYKPIRQDFIITNINKTNRTPGEYQNYPNSGNPIKYKFNGILNVPLGFRKMPWSSSNINARQAMFNISNTVGIGFATNFDTNSNVDVMRWINTQNKSYYDFMREITQHSCYSPYTFFTSFIDQYYVLNYVECRRLLSHGGKKEDLPQMIYNCVMPDISLDKSERSKGYKNKEDDLEGGDQKISYYFLTNSAEFKGWTNYIEEYFELNDGHSIVSDGYSKVLSYSDKSGFPNLSSKSYQFLLTPIDNIKRDNDRKIMSLPDKVTKDTYIPLNLRQTTNSAYSETQNLCDNPTAAESRVDLGEVDTSNNFPLYFYASVQNDFQMKNFKKCGLSVRLQNYNPSITRYSRIWIDIYDMNRNSMTQIQKDGNVENMAESKAKEYLNNKNKNIISFKEDEKNNTEFQAYNRSLSGWYVVTDMKISYNTVKDFKGNTHKKLQTHLTLNRIEYRPSFYSDYEMAKKAIDKYKNDNLSDNIMCGGDIM